MNQVRTKRIITKEEVLEAIKKRDEEVEKEIEELDAPELSREAKELLVGIRRSLRDIEEGNVYTMDEVLEMLFGEKGLCN